MTSPGSSSQPHAGPSAGPPFVVRRLEQVVRRIRALYLVAGVSRVWALVLGLSVALYAADRLLDLPVAVRAVVLTGLLVWLGFQVWRRVLRPLVVGVSALEAARLVEDRVPGFEGRLVSALQLGRGAPGSMEERLATEAADACEGVDLRRVLTARPTGLEALRAAGASLAAALLVTFGEPHLDVFMERLALGDAAWPRDTRMELVVAERSPVHVRQPDSSIIASRDGVVNISALWEGVRPDRVELLIRGSQGTRSGTMTTDPSGRFHGHFKVLSGDTTLAVTGGDDDGEQNRITLRVVEPPRLEAMSFQLEFPEYLGTATRSVGPEGLNVPEGTVIELSGRSSTRALAAELQLLSRAEPVPLTLSEGRGPRDGPLVQRAVGSFVAEASDTLLVVLSDEHGLATPDPAHHALVVQEDRPPAMRVFAPPRSDIKVTASALVPFAVVAEDDHGVAQVVLEAKDGWQLPFERDPTRPNQHRLVLDIRELGLSGSLGYALEAADRRQLPGRGPQLVRLDGRRIDIVQESEVQRLLADRQLRLKENFESLRERQQRATETLLDLQAEPPEDLDRELVAAAVAQNHVTTRMDREVRELVAILGETMTNRLDPGPGADVLLNRMLDDWRVQPVDEAFAPARWRAMARDYASGGYGRLDLVGRLLDMSGFALELSEDLSPAAHEALLAARKDPGPAAYKRAAAAQEEVRVVLERLLGRMDEWEDYQEVVTLVKSLIDDQESLRARTEEALKGAGGN
jgi:hypothetical protein